MSLKAAFVHLKRVIVTPAVYRSLASLKEGLRYRHWADVTFYTNLYRLAESCVFVKQSDLLSLCALQSHIITHDHRDPLYRRYGANLPSSLS